MHNRLTVTAMDVVIVCSSLSLPPFRPTLPLSLSLSLSLCASIIFSNLQLAGQHQAKLPAVQQLSGAALVFVACQDAERDIVFSFHSVRPSVLPSACTSANAGTLCLNE